MTLTEIAEQCAKLGIYETRCVTDEFVDIVFYGEKMNEWMSFFETLLGPAVKAVGKAPSRQDMEITKGYGGIRKEQVLYIKNCDKNLIIAMFWPWQGNQYITLKMAIIRK